MTVALAVLAGLAAYFFGLFVTYRRRLYVATGRDLGYKIPTMQLEKFHECFHIRPGDAPAKSEVMFLAGSHSTAAGTTDREAWILCMLAKGSQTLFEFGTASGKTAYLLARNAPPTARVITLTLPPERLDLYHHEGGDSSRARKVALAESRQQVFVYCGTEVEPRITQLFGDSKALDTAPYRSRCDLVFVDGAHAFSYVMSDSVKAFEMVAPHGVVVWHDYKRRSRAGRDVVRALDTIARSRRLARLAGTSLVAYRADWSLPVDV